MFNRKRIMIVDDDASSLSALAELMRAEGYEVAIAADGLAAVPKLGEFAPDLILTDLHMPRLDGLGLLRKSLEQDAERPVILMTAAASTEVHNQVMRSGATECLLKPISLRIALSVIERALERRGSRA